MKQIAYFTIIYCVFIFLLGNINCQPISKPQQAFMKGETMGTYYAVKYISPKRVNHQKAIDSLLTKFNQSVSTYLPASKITHFNRMDTGRMQVDTIFAQLIRDSKKIYQATNGAFDPTVMPLVNAWGFGYTERESVDSLQIDSLMQFVDFEYIILLDSMTLMKKKQGIQLDFSAIAKGYAVDLICKFLEKQQIQHYLVDIGGELRAKGYNLQNQLWTVGIDKPVDSLATRNVQHIVSLENCAIATSGNYRNFYLKDGRKYAHTIHPKTGYPELSNLLSATIIAPNCLMADAYATACMVLGYEKAKKMVEQFPQLEAILIYSDEQGKLKSYVTKSANLVY